MGIAEKWNRHLLMKIIIMTSIVVLLLLTFSILAQGFMFNDECTIYPKWPAHGLVSADDITVKTSCKNGTVDWNYPQGNVLIHFPFGGTFSVCIVDSLGGDVLKAVDMSGRCYKQLPALSQSPICVEAIGGRVDIQLQAPETKYYMAAVDYYMTQERGLRCS